MKNAIRSPLKIAAGVFLIVFGILGHLLPLLPGLIFITAGLLLLADEIPSVKSQIARLEIRYPKIRVALKRIKKPDGTLNLSKVSLWLLGIIAIYMIIAYAGYRFVFPKGR